MYYAGIDPGKNGALAIIYPDGTAHVTPLASLELTTVLKALSKERHRVCLEQVHAMPQQGVTSTFTFGMHYGWIKGILDAYNISYQEVAPQKWKRSYALDRTKQKSVDVCRKLFPEVSLKPTERSKVDNDNMAEALLLAEYGRRNL